VNKLDEIRDSIDRFAAFEVPREDAELLLAVAEAARDYFAGRSDRFDPRTPLARLDAALAPLLKETT
jgi:hypothetical protein